MWRSWEHVTGDFAAVFWHEHHLVVADPVEIRRILNHPEIYSPSNALDAVTPLSVPALRILAKHRFRLPATLANNGGDSHPVIRERVFDSMRPERVEALRPWLTGIVRRRCANLSLRLRQGESVDLHAELVTDLPLLVLSKLIELPIDDIRRVKDFSAAALELFWGRLDSKRQATLAQQVGEYHAQLRLTARHGPGLAQSLRHAQLHEDEVTAALFFLLVAGQETTSQFLTLLIHRVLDSATHVRQDLASGAVTIAATVEEGLRLDPPIVSWRRVAAIDTTIGGIDVAAGTSVLLWLGGANRQEAASAHAFVPGQRGSRRHVSFGAGAHRCLGSQLARMEAAVVLEELAPLLPHVEVIAAPKFPENLSFRMPDSLVVRICPGQEAAKNRLADRGNRLNVDKEPSEEVIQK